MDGRDLAIVRGLVAVAWADGVVSAQETAVVDALLEAYKATPSEVYEVKQFASVKRSLSDIALHDLGIDDRRVLLHHAVMLTYADGEQHAAEKQLLEDLAAELHLSPMDAERVVHAAEKHALQLLTQG